MKPLHELTVLEARIGLRAHEFTAAQLTEACLQRIHELNPTLNAFITVTEDLARAEAKIADERLNNGTAEALTGIPFAVKDAICTEGVRSTGAAKILDTYVAPYDATVVARLRKQGAVLLGKTNCDAFGHGASNENSMYGPVRNPHDHTKVAGGSSGGGAAAVAAGMGLFGIAEDTGGSIRQPASFCGIVGLRPSYGRNSRYGAMPMASSLDTVGPFTKTAEDMALVMEAIAGNDPHDASTVTDAVPRYSQLLSSSIKGLRVGVPKEYFAVEGMDPEVRSITENAIDMLRELGCSVHEVSLPYTKYAIAVYYILVPCEDSSNLARLDGIRYGVRQEQRTLYDTYAFSRAAGFPEEVKRRILIGTYALSAGYYDAYYKKAQAVRTLIKQDFDTVFNEVDVLITPTSPMPAFGIGEKASDPLALYLADVMVSPAAIAGVPAISVPAGKTQAGLPVGVQFIGKRLNEAGVLQVAHAFQSVLP